MAKQKTRQASAPADAPQRKKGAYPYYLLKSCLALGGIVKDAGGDRVDVPKSVVAEGLDVEQTSSNFAQFVASAKCYGIVDGHTALRLTDLGRDHFMPTTENGARCAELEFLSQPPTFSFLIEKFDGSTLPAANILANLLAREFGIPDSWNGRVAQIFISSANDLGVIDQGGCLRYDSAKHKAAGAVQMPPRNDTSSGEVQAAQRPQQNQPGGTTDNPQQTKPNNRKSKVWVWEDIRLETPGDLTLDEWEQLRDYVGILRPKKSTNTEGSQSGSTS
jgi:hypothetical protein